MELPILIEPNGAGGFRAKSGLPFPFVAEGATAVDATRRLQELIEHRLHSGSSQLSTIQVPMKPFPVAADDAYKTHWAYRELTEAIAKNRCLEDESNVL
jgi:hypothetical protein